MNMNANASLHAMPRQKNAMAAAFTLIELLVVIAIIGILAAIGLPAIRGMTKSNAMIAGNRQLLDDVAYARQRAIADHTTIYMVFIPPYDTGNFKFDPPGAASPLVLKQYTNLWGGQFTTYALLSLRSVGEQPGRATPHYLTDWRSLPTGVFIATNKFNCFVAPAPGTLPAFPVTNIFNFPMATNIVNPTLFLPYVAFDYLGRLITGRDEYIPLARGSVFPVRDAGGNFINVVADAKENPLNNSIISSNVIHIDWLTGKARTERVEVK